MKPAEICIFIWPMNYLFFYFSFSPLNVKLAFDCVFLSLSSSQWQHEQQGGAVVLLWGSGAGGHDPRTDLLPEEILWSAESRIKTLNKNTLSHMWFTSFTNWTSNSTEIRRTWLFASPQVFLFSFAPLVNLFIVCFGKGCKFDNKLIHWFCFSPTCVRLFGSGIFLFLFFCLVFFSSTVTIAHYYENEVKVMLWCSPNERTCFRIVWNSIL